MATALMIAEGTLTDLGQIADGVITRGRDGKGFENKGGDAGEKGCGSRG